ncbi:FecR family protein [Flavobacterium granuli]|uniref:FecR family protein n=1 Tax=Flavobacterium granuli TaxID=280093 RepID=A0A1M5S6F1_9FLAO|nr:FecR family protein [Flavobacterium granuli]PRZ21225.1 FecR family protein [Flavobacterium granuli]SHH34066.1 FecR family protein [Flavobacterium granuli]
MPNFKQIINLSKSLAASFLDKKKNTEIVEQSQLFNDEDKNYIIKNINDDSSIEKRQNLVKQIDKEADWINVVKRIELSNYKFYWRLSAAAIISGVLLTGYFFKDTFFGTSLEKMPIVLNVKPGKEKAILTLEDGSNITLEKGKNYVSNNLNSNGEKLVYNSGANSKSKNVFNYLTIPRGGQYFVKLSDGTKVWLNSGSKIKYPVAFVEGEIREVELVYGEAYFDVSPSTDHKGSKFKVLNQNQQVEVLGTEFNIKAYRDDDNVYTTLVEGKVTVGLEGKKQYLKPSQRSVLDIDNQMITISTVDVYNEISWKQGIFSFEDLTLRDITKVLSRWYDVDFVFLNKSIENKKFVGVLDKNQNLEDILSTIKNFGIIREYRINERTIVLK